MGQNVGLELLDALQGHDVREVFPFAGVHVASAGAEHARVVGEDGKTSVEFAFQRAGRVTVDGLQSVWICDGDLVWADAHESAWMR